jgi:hypothetical protein
MANPSNARKLGRVTGVATRLVIQRAGRTRTVGAVRQAVRASAFHFKGVLGQLWLEVTGFVFLALAGIGAIAFAREYGKYHAGQVSSGRVALALCFSGLFGWFGLSSFWRVRKRSGSR